ncbi:Pkinase-domain-containing protein [Basidiobolus meristosporus CBS 931.73]|uniref:Pkinase-domain-containing protein n=1 Tax=Basidiobolus meristosporus CBS 931.73 TaxID=1314790 RepID=A0A1Y1Y339_9FUNG|nr:Pkinase-domain-containing protein [Basidiobolus meristosporus CBS 931.73]|eukprot:ORX92427.1 Pkinase-domain-containing protein [Basidiobolus meristosporus CBS 931.73]
MIRQIKNFLKTATSIPNSDPPSPTSSNNPSSADKAVHLAQAKPEAIVDQNTIFKHPKYAADPNLPVYPNLDRYQLLTKLGDGAFSNVYKAYDRYRRKLIAIKVVRKFELNSLQRGNILKEVTIMRTLNHPNIAKLLDFKESKDFYYLVLELLTGGELFHRIVKLTYFSEDLARHVITQVAHGIHYLHEEKGVVHRDIKPENLLFEPIPFKSTPQKPTSVDRFDEEKVDEGEFIEGIGGGGIGVVKIADFGLSKVIWNKDTMTPCGTVGYTAPEIVRDEGYSKAVDMWALGCVLYTMLCGFPPFYDDDIKVLTEKVARGYYSFLSPWWDDISDSAKDLVSHLLDINPERRYTINQLLAHPWIRAKKAVQFEPSVNEITPQPIASNLPTSPTGYHPEVAPMYRPTQEHVSTPYNEAPRTHVRRERHPIPVTPNVSIKEAFDVSYAMHRMEDEEAGKRRMRAMQEQYDKAQGIATPYAPYYHQRALMDIVDGGGYEEDMNTINLALGAQTKDPYQPRTRNIGRSNQAMPMNTGRPIDSKKESKRAGFELNMNNATLLSRRKQKQPEMVN